MKLKKIAVFLGSNVGKTDIYRDAIKNLADCLSKNNIHLVYGGAKNGLMGVLADQMITNNGEITGVIPKDLIDSEVHHPKVNDLREVETMHDRKELMSKIADAFILCPGGCGSLDEFFEIYTWAQLNFHTKPIAVLNTNSYYKYLLMQLDTMVEQKFMKQEHRDMLIVSDNPDELLKQIRDYKHP